MDRGRPGGGKVRKWGNACSGPHEVRGLDGSNRFQQRGNHELRGTHSAFTQLGWVSIPSGALQFNCSTKKVDMADAAIRKTTRTAAVRAVNEKAPDGSSPAGCLQWSRTGCPVSAASATASATAAGRGTAARRGTATGRRAAAGRGAPVSATRPPAATAAPGPAAPTALARPAPVGFLRLRPAGDDHGEHEDDHQNPEESCHCSHRPSIPRSEPPASLRDRFLCETGMPPAVRTQSRLEQLQSFGTGWRP